MAMTIAEVVVESLKNAGVKRVYGLPGDSLNGFTDALRKDGSIEWIHVRNEESQPSPPASTPGHCLA